MDWCHTDGMVPNGPAGVYPAMSKALNRSGRPIHFNMCEWGLDDPWEWGGQYAQTWRVFGDHHGVWNIPGGTRDVVNQSMYLPAEFTGRPYAWNDLDMLETGNGGWAKGSNQSAVEYRTEFSMWAILASPLVVTTPLYRLTGCESPLCNGRCQDCRPQDKNQPKGHCLGPVPVGNRNKCPAKCKANLTNDQASILLNQDVIAINQDITPQGRPVTPGDSRVWSRSLSDGSTAFALYNVQDTPLTISTAPIKAACKPVIRGAKVAAACRVRDLWAQLDYMDTTLPPTAHLAPHATELYRIYPAREFVT